MEKVKLEAENLKRYATNKEVNRLHFDLLDPYHAAFCIYGQLTGDCHSFRSVELLEECTKPFSESIGDFQPIRTKIFTRKYSDFAPIYSPIEFFIAQDLENQPENNKRLISFLKGKSETLEFV